MLFYNNDFSYSPFSTHTHFGTIFRHLTVTEFVYFLFLFFATINSEITRKTIPTYILAVNHRNTSLQKNLRRNSVKTHRFFRPFAFSSLFPRTPLIGLLPLQIICNHHHHQ